MKSLWVLLGAAGGVCFLTMGLPVLLAVGLTGLLSINVWPTLAVALAGAGGLVATALWKGRTKSVPQGGDDAEASAVSGCPGCPGGVHRLGPSRPG